MQRIVDIVPSTVNEQYPTSAKIGEVFSTQDANGVLCDYIYCQNKTAGALAAGDPVRIGFQVAAKYLVALALADGATYDRVAVAVGTVTTDYYGWYQLTGVATLTVASADYTATYGLKVHDGAVANLGAALAYANTEFAAIITGGTGVTSLTVLLLGRLSLGTT